MATVRKILPSSVTPAPRARPLGRRRTPRWDPIGRTLWFGATLIKRLKVPARNQDLVLAAFEEQKWPPWIDDPIPPTHGINPKDRLHNTLSRLNMSHRRCLIHFVGNGTGRGIGWELLPARVGKRRKRASAASRAPPQQFADASQAHLVRTYFASKVPLAAPLSPPSKS